MDIDSLPDATPVEEHSLGDMSGSDSIGEEIEGKRSEIQLGSPSQRISRLRGLSPVESTQKPLNEVTGRPGPDSWKYGNVSAQQSGRLAAILKTIPKIDIKTYLNRHTGVICIAEAEIIADLYPDLAKEAITVAVEICFQYNFVTSWTRLKTKYIENSDIFDGQVYEDWLTATESQAIETLSRLDRDLSSYKARLCNPDTYKRMGDYHVGQGDPWIWEDLSSNKARLCNEGIRDTYKRMGDYHVGRGDPWRALACYMCMKDYCTTPVQLIEMYIKNIEVSIGLKNFGSLKNFVRKAEQIDAFSSLPILQAQAKIASALALLDNKEYSSAAVMFLEHGHSIGTSFSHVLLVEDAAVYGGLLGIASLPREKLNKLCKSSDGPLVALLELVPWVRDIVMDFNNNSWKSCLEGLERMLPILNVDIYLHPHISYLLHAILNNCLIQCFIPYSSILFSSLAESVGLPISEVEILMRDLIINGNIAARIDSQNSALLSTRENQRSDCYRNGDIHICDGKERIRIIFKVFRFSQS